MSPILPDSRPLETREVRSAFALRFLDAATSRPVTDGLVVEVRPLASGWPVRRAVRTPRGLYAFSRVPGLAAAEGTGPEAPLPRLWLEVRDPEGRFLPVGLELDLARPPPGMLVGPMGAHGSPPASPPGSPPASPPGSPLAGPGAFFLFSAPARPLDARFSVVRGQLERDGPLPRGEGLGHALLTLVAAGERYFGLTDAEGRFVIAFPHPAFEPGVGSPPPGGPVTPIERQRWPLELQVASEPAALEAPISGRPPDLRSVLRQRPGSVYALAPERGGAPSASRLGELEFRQTAVLRTEPGSTLIVAPA